MAKDFIRKGRLTHDSDLVNMVTKNLVGSSKIRARSIRATDAGFCPRKVVLQLNWDKDERTTNSPASTFYFKLGNSVHDIFRDTFDKMGILEANELRVTYYKIHGFIDNVIVSPTSGNLKIVDIKTCGKLPTKPKTNNMEQLLTYCLITGIHEASILYFSRSVAGYDGIPRIREIVVDVNDELLDEMADRIATSFVAEKYRYILPKPDYRTSQSSCGFCPLKQNHGCWGEELNRLDPSSDAVEFNEDLVPKADIHDFRKEVELVKNKMLGNQEAYYKKTLGMIETWKKTHGR